MILENIGTYRFRPGNCECHLWLTDVRSSFSQLLTTEAKLPFWLFVFNIVSPGIWHSIFFVYRYPAFLTFCPSISCGNIFCFWYFRKFFILCFCYLPSHISRYHCFLFDMLSGARCSTIGVCLHGSSEGQSEGGPDNRCRWRHSAACFWVNTRRWGVHELALVLPTATKLSTQECDT